MVSNKILSSKRVLSVDECSSLIKGLTLPKLATDELVAKLDKSVDQGLYQVFGDASRSCNPMKLAISGFSSLSVYRYSAWRLGTLQTDWSADCADTKLAMLAPLCSFKSASVSVELGSMRETSILEDGVAYFWPAMARFFIDSDCPEEMFFISGKVIGKKLN